MINGEKLNLIRTLNHVTMQEVANEFGCSKQYIKKLEHDEDYCVTEEQIYKIIECIYKAAEKKKEKIKNKE